MTIPFVKYQATGNDFVLIDNLSGKYSFTHEQIQKICDRRFGIGADGLMLIEKHPSLDFNLVYYNSDGSQSLCGNGSRAAVKMAASLGLLKNKTTFQAYDGPHEAELLANGVVRLKMNDVSSIRKEADYQFLNTGSPHYIRFVNDASQFPVVEEGRKVRYSEDFKPGGTNANFVEPLSSNSIFVRTYERGVEDETFSCGTGVTAAALAANSLGYTSPVTVKVKGGELAVEFKSGQGGMFTDIFLIGPAKKVFEGTLEL